MLVSHLPSEQSLYHSYGKHTTHHTTQNSLGATGFVGGDLLSQLQTRHAEEFSVTCLVRTEEKGEQIRKVYPDVRVVLGDNDDGEVIEREVREADIVFRKSISVAVGRF
jgi:putative NADH-flavin reductase